MGGPRRTARVAPRLAVALLAGLLLGCGSSGPAPPWRTGHPDPASLSLLDAAQAGKCAASAPAPDEAPAAISFDGGEYVQSTRTAPLAVQPGVEIDHTGNWAFFLNNDGSLTMTAPEADFLYVTGAC